LLARQIVRPIEELAATSEAVANGDLSQEIEVKRNDEIGKLATAFNLMTTQLRDLIGGLEKLVTERTRALEASMEVSRSVSTILDQRQLVSEVVEQVRGAFNYYHVHIYTVDENTNDLIMAGGTGEAGQALLGGGHKIASGKGLVGRAATTKSTILVSDVEEEEGWLPNPLLPDTQAEIAVPMVIGEQVFGVLDVQQNEAGSLTETDAQLLESVANQVAIALRNARLYEGAQTQARQETIANSIGQKLQTAADIESVLQIAAQELGKALKTQRATIQLGTMTRDENGHH
jgi:GAF domain-containing protein/HAMP domain-containing protein